MLFRSKDVMELTASIAYNKSCQAFCQEHKKRFHFVDIDKIVSEDALADAEHFTRAGYYALSVHIMHAMSAEQPA